VLCLFRADISAGGIFFVQFFKLLYLEQYIILKIGGQFLKNTYQVVQFWIRFFNKHVAPAGLEKGFACPVDNGNQFDNAGVYLL
jgi:hypothetical protein